VRWFRGGLVFKAHRLVYHSSLGWRVIKKKKHRCRAKEARFKKPGPDSGPAFIFKVEFLKDSEDFLNRFKIEPRPRSAAACYTPHPRMAFEPQSKVNYLKSLSTFGDTCPKKHKWQRKLSAPEPPGTLQPSTMHPAPNPKPLTLHQKT